MRELALWAGWIRYVWYAVLFLTALPLAIFSRSNWETTNLANRVSGAGMHYLLLLGGLHPWWTAATVINSVLWATTLKGYGALRYVVVPLAALIGVIALLVLVWRCIDAATGYGGTEWSRWRGAAGADALTLAVLAINAYWLWRYER